MLQFLYTPQAILSILTANAFTQRPDHTKIALIVQVASWVAQIAGHKFAEGRSPALLDNPVNGSSLSRLIKKHADPVSALILAPFFVHLEILFKLGYKPAVYRQLQNDVGMEIANLRKTEGDKKRAAEKRTD